MITRVSQNLYNQLHAVMSDEEIQDKYGRLVIVDKSIVIMLKNLNEKRTR